MSRRRDPSGRSREIVLPRLAAILGGPERDRPGSTTLGNPRRSSRRRQRKRPLAGPRNHQRAISSAEPFVIARFGVAHRLRLDQPEPCGNEIHPATVGFLLVLRRRTRSLISRKQDAVGRPVPESPALPGAALSSIPS